jgi:predicted MFS family arabinose efflux permease
MAVAFYILIPTLPLYIVNVLKEPKSSVGLTLASFTIAALIIRLFTGFALDAYGRKYIYIISFFIFCLIFGLYPFASSIVFLFIIRFIHGFAWGITGTAGSTVAVDLIPPKKRGEGIGYYGLAMTLAMSVGPMVGLFICNDGSYTRMFIIATAIALAGFIMIAMIRFPKFTRPEQQKSLKFNTLIEKSALPASLNIIMVMIPYGAIISFITLYGKEIGINNTGTFFMILAIGLGLTRIYSGKIFDRSGPRTLSISGILLLVFGFIILATFKSHAGFHLSGLILGFGFGTLFPLSQAMVNNLVEPHQRGAANSTLFTAFDIGIGIGMVLIGFLADHIGLANSFYVCAAICLVALIHSLTFVLNHYHKQLNLKNENSPDPIRDPLIDL